MTSIKTSSSILIKYGKLYGNTKTKKKKKMYGVDCRSIAFTKEQFANELRHRMTGAEKRLWLELQTKGFLAQVVVQGFIPDFYLPTKKIIIEVDGSIHDTQSQKKYDKWKDQILKSNGYKVVRFKNHQIFTSLEEVIKGINKLLSDNDSNPRISHNKQV